MIPWRTIDSFPGNRLGTALTAHRTCPICGADKPCNVLSMHDFQWFSDDAAQPKRVNIHQVQCSTCAALYLNPAYTSYGFQTLFTEAGCSYGATAGRPQEQLQWLTEQKLLRERNRLLDVGCYDGRFLATMPPTVQRLGIDIDLPAIERGRHLYGKNGVTLIHGDFDQFQLEKAPDAITLFHVLEHLPNPVATLTHLREIAALTTRLVVEVPILEKGFTNDINGFFSVQHMTHFSRGSLANTLARAGWTIDIQLEQPDYNGYRVLCQPTEMRSNISAVEDDRAMLMSYLQHYQGTIQSVKQRLVTVKNAEKVMIWGGGLHTEFLYQLTDLFKAQGRQFVIIDSDPMKQGKSWRGIAICSPQILAEDACREVPLVISSYGGQPAIAQAALQAGFPEALLVRLYQNIQVY